MHLNATYLLLFAHSLQDAAYNAARRRFASRIYLSYFLLQINLFLTRMGWLGSSAQVRVSLGVNDTFEFPQHLYIGQTRVSADYRLEKTAWS